MPRWLLSPQVLLRSVSVVAVGAVLVAVVWALAGARTAQAVYLGLVFMLVAVVRLPVPGQLLVGLSAGVAAAGGTAVAGHTVSLILATVAACALQWPFDRQSVAVAALLPANVVLFAALDTGQPLRMAVGSWLGAGLAIAVAALAGMRAPGQPVRSALAAGHAAELAAGCAGLIIVTTALGIPRVAWAVLTLCLVFQPSAADTRQRVANRVLGTAAGAVAATAIAIAVPRPLGLAVAGLCAVGTVGAALARRDLPQVVFLTATVLLLFGSAQPASVLSLAAQRLEMTVLGAGLAVLLTALTAWFIDASRRQRMAGRAAP